MLPERQKITPPEMARRLGISADKVLRWIAAGELRAVNVATKANGRPRYVIDAADLAAFENRRAAKPTTAAPRRRKASEKIIRFF